jgi:uncharacterized MAPEG superfamily protein
MSFSSLPTIDAYAALLGGALLAFVPHALKIAVAHPKLKKGYDLRAPRLSTEAAIDSTPEGLFVARCQGAHANALESYPFFVAAVLCADLAGVPRATTDRAATFFVASRVLYTLLYVYGTNKYRAMGRSATWFAGLGALVWLLLQASAARSAK